MCDLESSFIIMQNFMKVYKRILVNIFLGIFLGSFDGCTIKILIPGAWFESVPKAVLPDFVVFSDNSKIRALILSVAFGLIFSLMYGLGISSKNDVVSKIGLWNPIAEVIGAGLWG